MLNLYHTIWLIRVQTKTVNCHGHDHEQNYGTIVCLALTWSIVVGGTYVHHLCCTNHFQFGFVLHTIDNRIDQWKQWKCTTFRNGTNYRRRWEGTLRRIFPGTVSHSSQFDRQRERKEDSRESPKAAAPTTAGPGYHLAPGNTLESHRRHRPLPTSNHEQRGRDTTTTTAACCRCGEPIQPGSRSFRGG